MDFAVQRSTRGEMSMICRGTIMETDDPPLVVHAVKSAPPPREAPLPLLLPVPFRQDTSRPPLPTTLFMLFFFFAQRTANTQIRRPTSSHATFICLLAAQTNKPQEWLFLCHVLRGHTGQITAACFYWGIMVCWRKKKKTCRTTGVERLRFL